MGAEDFVSVRLSARGEELAGAGAGEGRPCLRVIAGHLDLSLEPGQSKRVTRGEWAEILSTPSVAPLLEMEE